MEKYKHFKGFTIIEVVLVLAIAGLIFLMVFIALPALQRSQRDAQRKNSASLIIDAYRRKYANNRGIVTRPRVSEMVADGYLTEDQMRDPSTGQLYEIDMSNNWGGPLYVNYQSIKAGYYGFDDGGYCQNNIPRDIVGNDNKNIVVVFGLEGGGWYCASNDMR
ncbi:MAG: prepilin-type N-terminal cleavage/methylation domain-containing protein [bacterium]|nr:prepilin-type N-terminal cleavage/methylation domain-containing protein [bacterium]